jgi:ferric-dicitrate binding protein FerR (iron transport regulator)
MIMNDKVRLLLHKKWTGQLSDEELSQLEALLSSDPGLRKEALALESLWAKAERQASPNFVPDAGKAWARFKKDMDGGAPVVVKPPRVLTLLPFALVGKAAAAVAFVVMSYLVIQFMLPQGSTAVVEKIKPHPESVMGGLILPDSSVVWINSNTSFRYPKSFDGDERRVFLDGEAHFQVRKNSAKPFIVETPNGEVRVLGTAFNVNAYSSGEFEEVFVETGLVAFKAKEGADERKLEKGNSARLKKSTLQFVPTQGLSPSTAVKWKLDALNFRDTPLKHILDALERNTPMRFDRKGILDILNCPFTISLQGADEETVVKYLKAVTGVKVRLDASSYVYYLSGGRKC